MRKNFSRRLFRTNKRFIEMTGNMLNIKYYLGIGSMVDNIIPLNLLPPGRKAKVKKLSSTGIIRRRMLDLGLITDTEVEVLQKSPSAIQQHIAFVVQ